MSDKEILAITAAIDPRELTGEMRRARLAALRDEAARAARQEEQAEMKVSEARRERQRILDNIGLILREK